MKLKTILCFLLVLVALFAVSCGGTKETEQSGYELALITDVGTIDDRSFNQGAWEGLKKYAEENKKTYKYYQPKEKTTDAYIDAIDLAVAAGAKVIVTPGFLFEPAVYKAQDMHTNTRFILLDGSPQDGTYTDFRIEKNVYSIFYAEEQSGFLAGYAAVKEGFKKLGFMGGIAVPAVIRFGYGFIQGADAAAQEIGLKAGEVTVRYTYVGNFNATPENQTLASSWYRNGVQVIFACGGGVGNSVMAAAEQNNGYVIGVDVDQSGESKTVITSAVKMLGNSVYQALDSYYKGEFPGGVIATLDAKVDGIGLPDDLTRFKNFVKADYDKEYKKLVDGAVVLQKDKDAKDPTTVSKKLVTVEFIK